MIFINLIAFKSFERVANVRYSKREKGKAIERMNSKEQNSGL